MKNILIVDTETTGLDSSSDAVIEIGAILYSVEHQTTIAQVSHLIESDCNPCESVNRIPSTVLKNLLGFSEAYAMVGAMRDRSDAYVAHNAEFDNSFLEWNDKPWLCTCFDFQWPDATKEGGSLINIALEHGIGVSSAHRALTDCQLIATLFDRMNDLDSMIEHAARPKGVFAANVSYDDKDLAKDAGFKWNPETKQWTRRMAVEDAEKLSFPVRQLSSV